MNKLIRVSFVALVTGLLACTSSCGNSSNQASANVSDSTTVAASGTAATTATEEAPQAETSTYYSDDLKAYGLKGKVKSVAIEQTGLDELHISIRSYWPLPDDKMSFTSQGKFVGEPHDFGKKNSKGLFVSWSNDDDDDGTERTTTYKELNEHNFPLVAEMLEDGPFGKVNATMSYSDYTYDDHNNWTSRKVTCKKISYIEDQPANDSFSWTETAKYIYY